MKIFNERLSLDRPSWTSDYKTGGLYAFYHLHCQKGIVKNRFIRTHGFRTIEDYKGSKEN